MCPGSPGQKMEERDNCNHPKCKRHRLSGSSTISWQLTLPKQTHPPEYYIISKDRAKLGYAWRPVVIPSKIIGGYVCPDCGKLIIDNDGVPVSFEYFTKKKRLLPVLWDLLYGRLTIPG